MTDQLACVRGCTRLHRHASDCDQGDACRGCQPRLAEYGNLCWPDHKRLQMMLTDAPTVYDWLTANLPAGEGAARVRQDFERHGGTDGSPAPIKVAIFDAMQNLADSLAEFVDNLCDTEQLRGPDRHTPKADAGYLLAMIDRLERLDWVGDWWEHLAELMSEAHALAPWRPEARRVNGVPCPDCGECALVWYGGDQNNVTCRKCRMVIGEEQFGLWAQIITEAKAG